MRRYGERGRSLLELARALGSVRHMDEIDAWLRRAVPAFRCEQAYVSLLEPDEGYVETVARAGWEPIGDRFWLKDYPRTAELLDQRAPLIIRVDDPTADPAEVELLRALHVQSVLMAPLHAFARPVGMIELYRASVEPWGEEDLELLESIIGQLAAVLASLQPQHGEGRTTGTAEIRSREARERGEQAQRLESLGRLAGAVAHDFNNLLAVILGYAGELELELEDPDQRADVAEIRHAAERAARVTRQLLTFSRRGAADTELLDPCDVLRQIESLLRSSVGEHVSVELALDPVPPLQLNRGQFEQVVLNLAFNARDAMPAGGRLRIETVPRELELGEDDRLDLAPGRYAVLRVTDDGDGMDEWVAARAFEPFFTTKGELHGTGLGLATVHGIVRQARGDIVLETEKGRGTAVTVWLPVSTAEAAQAPPEPAERETSRPGTVLVVEDNASLRRVVSRTLTGDGYEVIEAVTAHEALECHAASTPPVDLVLSDVRLPGMSGIELVAELRRSNPTLAAVLMTGSLDRTQTDVDLPVLHKPFGREELLAALQQARG